MSAEVSRGFALSQISSALMGLQVLLVGPARHAQGSRRGSQTRDGIEGSVISSLWCETHASSHLMFPNAPRPGGLLFHKNLFSLL